MGPVLPLRAAVGAPRPPGTGPRPPPGGPRRGAPARGRLPGGRDPGRRPADRAPFLLWGAGLRGRGYGAVPGARARAATPPPPFRGDAEGAGRSAVNRPATLEGRPRRRSQTF